MSVFEKNFAAPKIITAATAITAADITNIPIAAGLILFFICQLFISYARVYASVEEKSHFFVIGI